MRVVAFNMKYPQVVDDPGMLQWLSPDLERLGVDADQTMCVARLLVSTLRCSIHSSDVEELGPLKVSDFGRKIFY